MRVKPHLALLWVKKKSSFDELIIFRLCDFDCQKCKVDVPVGNTG